jgi:hypothetical protein
MPGSGQHAGVLAEAQGTNDEGEQAAFSAGEPSDAHSAVGTGLGVFGMDEPGVRHPAIGVAAGLGERRSDLGLAGLSLVVAAAEQGFEAGYNLLPVGGRASAEGFRKIGESVGHCVSQ